MATHRSRGPLIATLVGESCREIAVLVLVFAPLDALTQGIGLTMRSWVGIIVAVTIVFAVGVYFETRWR